MGAHWSAGTAPLRVAAWPGAWRRIHEAIARFTAGLGQAGDVFPDDTDMDPTEAWLGQLRDDPRSDP